MLRSCFTHGIAIPRAFSIATEFALYSPLRSRQYWPELVWIPTGTEYYTTLQGSTRNQDTNGRAAPRLWICITFCFPFLNQLIRFAIFCQAFSCQRRKLLKNLTSTVSHPEFSSKNWSTKWDSLEQNNYLKKFLILLFLSILHSHLPWKLFCRWAMWLHNSQNE